MPLVAMIIIFTGQGCQVASTDAPLPFLPFLAFLPAAACGSSGSSCRDKFKPPSYPRSVEGHSGHELSKRIVTARRMKCGQETAFATCASLDGPSSLSALAAAFISTLVLGSDKPLVQKHSQRGHMLFHSRTDHHPLGFLSLVDTALHTTMTGPRVLTSWLLPSPACHPQQPFSWQLPVR